MIDPLIRSANEGDLSTLVAFNQAMALETENKTLDPTTLRQGVAAVLADPHLAGYLLAEVDGQVAGSLMITEEWSDWRAKRFWWIQSVYVAPAFRRQGIYSRLYQAVLARAGERGDICGIRLYVEQENSRAQATYHKLGMKQSHYYMFESE
ncbi:GNAT family N-acetyltransferase [Halioxenophilus sp. WMMB6]|uniref:GNAT family N-acetyltransferase n=1 Tax=Halioxenophilus sp. WMMB6 TaxID=3073815 RepID=UPI00295E2EB3|nr:GNAT family N-acetyltransferase [Halioxenophilus sp. WMMB6]